MLEGHALTHFMPLVLFDTLRKHPKTKGFCFQGLQKEISGMKWGRADAIRK